MKKENNVEKPGGFLNMADVLAIFIVCLTIEAVVKYFFKGCS